MQQSCNRAATERGGIATGCVVHAQHLKLQKSGRFAYVGQNARKLIVSKMRTSLLRRRAEVLATAGMKEIELELELLVLISTVVTHLVSSSGI